MFHRITLGMQTHSTLGSVQTQGVRISNRPVVVGVLHLVTTLYPLQVPPELDRIQPKVRDAARDLVEVKGQQSQGNAWGGLSKCKHIKLPVVFCTL